MSNLRPPDEELIRSLRTIAGALNERLGERDELRVALRDLARWFAAELDRPRAASAAAGQSTGAAAAQAPASVRGPEPVEPSGRVIAPPKALGHPTVVAPAPTVQVALRIGDTTVEGLRVAGTAEEARAAAQAAAARAGAGAEQRDWGGWRDRPPAPDLSVVEARAALKGEACRWAIERRALVEQQADFLSQIRPHDAALIDRARALPDCFLWMLDPRGTLPDDGTLEDLAGCYETLALAVRVANEIVGKPPARGEQPAQPSALRRDLYWLVAEAQSALRAAALGAGQQRPDRDQMEAFIWLREHTSHDRIFVDRHMKVEDPADPSKWRDLRARLEGLRKAFVSGRTEERRFTELKRKAAYHAQRLRGATGEETPESLHDWAMLYQAVEELVKLGVAPSNREITDAILPLLERAPESLEQPPGVEQAFAAAARLAEALAEAEEKDEGDEERERSDLVKEAAELLRGKVVVFIGGERRREAQARLERDLELAELRWNTNLPHQSLSVFEPEVSRPDVAVVLLAIRWSSHSYGELQDVCNRYGKIFVRLPGGYSSNQVAAQVLAQAGDRLRAAAAAR